MRGSWGLGGLYAETPPHTHTLCRNSNKHCVVSMGSPNLPFSVLAGLDWTGLLILLVRPTTLVLTN